MDPPALFTQMSSPPKASIAASANATRASLSVTSVGTASARPPLALIASATPCDAVDVTGRDDDGRAGVGVGVGDALTDALAAAGDDGDLAGEIETVHVVLPV